MAVDKFIYILFISVLCIQFIQIEVEDKKSIIKKQPQIVLTNSSMYSLNEDNMEQIITSKVFSKLDDTEELKYVKIESRKNSNILSANLIIKKANKLKLFDNIKYTQDNFISFETSKLNYDLETKIADNKVSFSGIYKNNIINGSEIYLDTKKNIMKAKKVYFKISRKDSILK